MHLFLQPQTHTNFSSNKNLSSHVIKYFHPFSPEMHFRPSASVPRFSRALSYPPAILWGAHSWFTVVTPDLYFTVSLKWKFHLGHSISEKSKGQITMSITEHCYLQRNFVHLVIVWPFLCCHPCAKLAVYTKQVRLLNFAVATWVILYSFSPTGGGVLW